MEQIKSKHYPNGEMNVDSHFVLNFVENIINFNGLLIYASFTCMH